MRSRCVTGGADGAQLLPLTDHVTGMDRDARQMCVVGNDTTMVDLDQLSVASVRAGLADATTCRRPHRRAGRRSEVEPGVATTRPRLPRLAKSGGDPVLARDRHCPAGDDDAACHA